jgi:hypothetical protein
LVAIAWESRAATKKTEQQRKQSNKESRATKKAEQQRKQSNKESKPTMKPERQRMQNGYKWIKSNNGTMDREQQEI